MSLQVLHEDNHLIAVLKPAGMLVQGDETGDMCLMDEVKKYLKEKYNKPGEVFLGLIHRLDRPVSGIVLFARTSKGASRLSEQFRSHSVKKIYHACVLGTLAATSGTLIHYLKKDSEKNIVSVFDRPADGAQKAELDYEVVKKSGQYSILKIILKTGRSHQIRSQLGHIGCPIVGDVKYGGEAWDRKKEIALCATDLEFKLPTKDEVKKLSTSIPTYWPV